ncbi:MAG: ATP-binding protein, partial [Micavibrio aeruginosavorus]
SAQREAEKTKAAPRGRSSQSVGDAAVKSLVRAASSSIGRTIARELIRGVMGSLSRR